MKKIVTLILSLMIGATLVACDPNMRVNKQDIGTVTGGALGGVLGSQIGGGHGRIAAVIGGTLLGAYLGGSVGRSMDEVDQMKMPQTLERAPVNTTQTWVNPDSNIRYEVTPTRTYSRAGRPCREYTTSAIIGGKREKVYGTACRTADGSWQIMQS